MIVRWTLIPLLLLAFGVAAESVDPVADARQLARAGHWDSALQLLEERLSRNPDDGDARVFYATLLSWKGELTSARRNLIAVLLSEPSNADADVALANVELWSGNLGLAEQRAGEGLARHADNVDLMVIRSNALRRLNRRGEAEAQIERAFTLAPDRDDVRVLRMLLRQEMHGLEARATALDDTWSDRSERLDQLEVALQRGTAFGAGTLRLTRGHRGGTKGSLIEIEAYPHIGRSYAYLEFGRGVGDLYGRSRFGAEFFKVVPPGGEASIGFRRLNFADPVNMLTGSASLYYKNFLVSARLFQASGAASGTSVLFTARRYFFDGVQYVGLRLHGGSLRDEIRTEADLSSSTVREMAAEGLFLFHQRWVLTMRAGGGQERSSGRHRIRRLSTSLGLGYRF